jgi:hypothetical protein
MARVEVAKEVAVWISLEKARAGKDFPGVIAALLRELADAVEGGERDVPLHVEVGDDSVWCGFLEPVCKMEEVPDDAE